MKKKILKSKKIYLVLMVLAIALLALCWSVYFRFCTSCIFVGKVVNKEDGLIVQIGSATIKAEVANTEAKWAQGLSGRGSLAENTGMFFVFERANYWGIWMKDMNFPIDVLWITEGLKVSDIVENMTPASYPKAYKPHLPVKYVLELPVGTVERGKIMIGQDVTVK